MAEQAVQTLLLVESDRDQLDWMAKTLSAKTLQVLKCDAADKALAVVKRTKVDLVVADLNLTPFDGSELLLRLRGDNPHAAVVLVAAFPSAEQVIEAMQRGAIDLLRKERLTFELRPLIEGVLSKLETRRLAATPEASTKNSLSDTIIGKSPQIQDVLKLIGRVAASEAPVLVTGESGCGKELVAAAVHRFSKRSKHEMIALNCGAIPENLLESELFGHERGSFTGASARRVGRFEQADGGTLFLDELGDMPKAIQVKLLRVLQEGTYSRVGANEVLRSDVRIIAATNLDLAAEVKAGRFREDLYYRLNVVEINLPPLRERPEDIPLLAEAFLVRLTRKQGIATLQFSQEALERLMGYAWPGNVRELQNTIARACALATSDILLPEDIPLGRGLALGGEFGFDALAEGLFDTPGCLLPKLKQWALSRGWSSERIAEKLGLPSELID